MTRVLIFGEITRAFIASRLAPRHRSTLMSSRRAGSPPTKRVKLESDSLSRPPSILEVSPHAGDIVELGVEADLVDEEHCSICLQPYVDRTLVPKCSHEFCFECLLIWTGVHHQ